MRWGFQPMTGYEISVVFFQTPHRVKLSTLDGRIATVATTVLTSTRIYTLN